MNRDLITRTQNRDLITRTQNRDLITRTQNRDMIIISTYTIQSWKEELQCAVLHLYRT